MRRIGESSVALLRNRFELFTVEWQEEKLRLLSLFVWLALAAVIGLAGVLIGLMALAFWLWTTTGYAGVIGLVVTAIGIACGILWGIRRNIQTGPSPFSQTVAEFRKDGECLRTKD